MPQGRFFPPPVRQEDRCCLEARVVYIPVSPYVSSSRSKQNSSFRPLARVAARPSRLDCRCRGITTSSELPCRASRLMTERSGGQCRTARSPIPALAGAGKLRIEWAESRMPVLMALREEHAKTRSPEGHAHRRLPPRHQGDRGAGEDPRGRRRRGVLVGLQPALHPGRRGRGPGRRGHLHLRLARHEPRGVLLVHRPDPRVQADPDPRRRRRPHLHGPQRAHRPRARGASAAPRRPPPACTACARWRRRGSSSTR